MEKFKDQLSDYHITNDLFLIGQENLLQKTISRYMSSSDLFSILKNNQFRIPQRNTFSDEREVGKCFSIRNRFPVQPVDGSNKEYRQRLDELIKCSYSLPTSCWNLANEEDFLMWKAYTKDSFGVRITTTVEKFYNAFEYSPFRCIICDEVEYDKERAKYSLKQELFTKTQYYGNEQEFRFYFVPKDNIKDNLFKLTDAEFIESITLSPFIEKSLIPHITKAIEDMAPYLEGKISCSKILEKR